MEDFNSFSHDIKYEFYKESISLLELKGISFNGKLMTKLYSKPTVAINTFTKNHVIRDILHDP